MKYHFNFGIIVKIIIKSYVLTENDYYLLSLTFPVLLKH